MANILHSSMNIEKIPTVLFSILKFLPDANEEQVDPKKNYANKQIKKSN